MLSWKPLLKESYLREREAQQERLELKLWKVGIITDMALKQREHSTQMKFSKMTNAKTSRLRVQAY